MNNSHVSLTRCSSYQLQPLKSAIEALLAPMGGIGSFVKKGQRVLIKPNLLADHTPEEATTTHPELIRALLHILKPTGAEVVVADSPASATKLAQVWEVTGFKTLCEEEGVELLSLEQGGSSRFERDGFIFHIAKPVLDADVVINVPKVKTHVLTTLTCGVKNIYGCIPGYQKAELHKKEPRPADFGMLLKAIYNSVAPSLTIADGIVGMQGDGPSGGEPAALGFLAASEDAYALDAVICEILNIPLKAVPYLAPDSGKEVTYHGLTTAELRPEEFKMPNTLRARMIPRWLVNIIAPSLYIRPAFSEACIKCGRCVEACPVDALSLSKQDPVPHLKGPVCIGCCCCHEMCPANAISMRTSPVIRAANALRKMIKRIIRPGGRTEKT